MKVVIEPSVYLVGRQDIVEGELERFLRDHEVSTWETDTDVAGQKLVEVAGRLCYMSFAKPRPGGNHGYINHILEVGHGSVLEHSVFNLIIAGVSRSFTHELVRHRAGMGYSQLSQRFVDESNCEFVPPPALIRFVEMARAFLEGRFSSATEAIRCDPPRHSYEEGVGLRWLASMEGAQRDYQYLSDVLMDEFRHIGDPTARRKAAREAARSVLPNATETKIFVTGNARAMRHFIEMRGNAAADAEIRRVALRVLGVLRTEASNLFGDYDVIRLDDGTFAVRTEHAKV